jgi:hypothetical protein
MQCEGLYVPVSPIDLVFTHFLANNLNEAFVKLTKKIISQMKPDDIVYVFLQLFCFSIPSYDHKINLNLDEAAHLVDIATLIESR